MKTQKEIDDLNELFNLELNRKVEKFAKVGKFKITEIKRSSLVFIYSMYLSNFLERVKMNMQPLELMAYCYDFTEALLIINNQKPNETILTDLSFLVTKETSEIVDEFAPLLK